MNLQHSIHINIIFHCFLLTSVWSIIKLNPVTIAKLKSPKLNYGLWKSFSLLQMMSPYLDSKRFKIVYIAWKETWTCLVFLYFVCSSFVNDPFCIFFQTFKTNLIFFVFYVDFLTDRSFSKIVRSIKLFLQLKKLVFQNILETSSFSKKISFFKFLRTILNCSFFFDGGLFFSSIVHFLSEKNPFHDKFCSFLKMLFVQKSGANL